MHPLHSGQARGLSPARAGRASRPRPLREVLAYRNPDVVEKFLERFEVSPDEALELFVETCRWLWLCARRREQARAGRGSPPPLAIDASLLMLDEMWHTFVLFTRDYARFCRRFLGGYVHHAPTPRSAKERARRLWLDQRARAERAELRRLTLQYAYVHAQLGATTLSKWYEEFPRRYPPHEVARRVRPLA